MNSREHSIHSRTQRHVSSPLRHPAAAVFKRKGSLRRGGEAAEAEAFLQPKGSVRGPLLRAIWQVFRSTFLLGTLSLIVSDVFRFTVPKLLR